VSRAGRRGGRKVAHLLEGMLLITLLFLALAFGSVPGGVVEQNLDHGIDATPFFYSEAEGVAQAGHEMRAVLASQPQ